MKHAISNITVCIVGFAFWLGCQNESELFPVEPPSLIPFFDLGDTLRNNFNTTNEEIIVVLDSSLQTGFKLTSTHHYSPQHSDTYFIRMEFDLQGDIRFLDSLTYDQIVSTFEYGDTINLNIANEESFDWFPKAEYQLGSSWLKYHIFTPSGGTSQNVSIGENYIVFKLGETGKERLGWFNIMYQDTLCYIKEGYYNSEPNQEIVVGSK